MRSGEIGPKSDWTQFLKSLVLSKMSLSHNSILAKSEPDWGSVDKTTLPRNAFADQGEPDKKSTWSYPHHWVENGKVGAAGVYDSGDMYLHRGGLNAAWAAAQGAHTGQKASAEVIAHLEAHRKAIGAGDQEKLAAMTAQLTAIGDKGSAEVSVLFDTGSGQSFIRRNVAERIATIVKLPKPISFRLADGATALTVSEVAILTIDAGGQSITDNFLILDDSINDIILGESTMRRFALKIDMERGQVYAEISEEKKEKVMWKKFLAAIGISVADEVTEEKAVELVRGKITAVTPIASPKILAVLDLKETATEDEVRGAILALKSPGNVVAAEEHEKLQGQLQEHKIIAAVANARAIGKLTPTEEPVWLKDLKDGKESLATFATFIERRGKVVPIDVKLAPKKDEPAASIIDDTQRAINKQMGVSEETFKKYNAPAA